jgi:hypothetical protein
MSCSRFAVLAALLIAAALPAFAADRGKPPCVPIADASQQAGATQPSGRDTCVAAHVYNVAEAKDGTRFLDVCPPDVTDADCRFLIVCLPEDRDDVGDLTKYRNADIQLRGVIRPMHGRMGMVLSHVRQFSGGPEKFRPNPRLLRGFNGQTERPPVRDPNLAASGRHRSFMNNRDLEELPVKASH